MYKLTIFFLTCSLVIISASANKESTPAKLKPIATTEFPEEITVKPFPATLVPVKNGQPNAVIAIQSGNRQPELAEMIQQKLDDSWGITFPIKEIADHHDGTENLILFGASNSNMLLRELAANHFINDHTATRELRVFPQVLDWQRGVIYLGGRTAAQVEESVTRFIKQFPKPAPLPFYSDSGVKTKYQNAEYYYDLATKYYADGDRDSPSRTTKRSLMPLVMAYRDTCDESYAQAAGKVISLMLEKYEVGKQSYRNKPQTFTFFYIPQLVFLIEHSSAFNAKHRRDAAELMRVFMEDAINYWEMTTPAKLYAKDKVTYLTNHYLFAARSSYHTSRYLLDRHAYEPACYWQAVANHIFAGVQDHPISPEDAPGYHFLVYGIFMDHALASGKYDIDFFRNERYSKAVHFAKMIVNHLGFTPGYGDSSAIRCIRPIYMLTEALDILNDSECAFLIDLIAQRSQNKRHLKTAEIIKMDSDIQPITNPTYFGLNALQPDAFVHSQYKHYPEFKRPILNKAIFRTGWNITSDFLAVNGLTSAPHGHDDAAGICQYINGEHIWLFEGHYINRHAEDHNVLNVIRDGMVPDRRRNFDTSLNMAAQIIAETQTAARDFALLSLLLEEYNGINQYRRFAWEGSGGFWVIDTALATQPGDYTLINQFRSTGVITSSPQGFIVTQQKSKTPTVPNRFTISEGGGSSKERYTKRETCHSRANTILPGYLYSDQNTRSLLQRQSLTMEKGDNAYFFNYLTPLPEHQKQLEVRRLANNAYLALSDSFPRLAVIGQLDLPQLKIKADSCFIAPHGVLVENGTEIVVGNRSFEIQPGATTSIEFKSEAEREAVRQTLSSLAVSSAEVLPSTPSQIISVPQKKFSHTLAFEHPISALTMDKETIAIGLTDGSFKLLNLHGKVLAERKFKYKISAVARINAGAKSRWMVGVNGKTYNSTKKVSHGQLYALDDEGKELWKATVPLFSGRYGHVTTIFPAYLDGRDAEPSIIAGAESWLYLAFDLDGKKRWMQRCTHGACGGNAGDLNGDGRDEVFLGNEYYYHVVIDAACKQVARTTAAPGDIDAKILDLNGDGMNEIIVGRNDGYLYVEGAGKNPLIGSQLNVGGQPKNIVILNSSQKSRLAVAAMSGVVTFTDADLKRVAHHVLPTSLAAMAATGMQLYTVALDNFVYEMDENKIKSKLPFHYNPDSLEQPRAVGNANALVVSSDTKLYLLQQQP